MLIFLLDGTDGESGPGSTGSHVPLRSDARHPGPLFQAGLCFSPGPAWESPRGVGWGSCSRQYCLPLTQPQGGSELLPLGPLCAVGTSAPENLLSL